MGRFLIFAVALRHWKGAVVILDELLDLASCRVASAASPFAHALAIQLQLTFHPLYLSAVNSEPSGATPPSATLWSLTQRPDDALALLQRADELTIAADGLRRIRGGAGQRSSVKCAEYRFFIGDLQKLSLPSRVRAMRLPR